MKQKMKKTMTFYETLASIMNIQGISFAELSRRTGLNQPYFSKLKAGTMKDATWDKAVKIIDALGMTPNDFLNIQRGKRL